MNGAELITAFELYIDDSSELSESEELNLCNKVYHKILDDRHWEFLKKEDTGAIAGTTIALPADFKCLTENDLTTNNSIEINNNARPIGVYIDDMFYQTINWSDRKKISDNQCYIDLQANTIVFPNSMSGTYSFDYIYTPDDLTTATSPVFPARYHAMIAHGMTAEGFAYQLFDKNRSYAGDNMAMYQSYLDDLAMYNSEFYNG